MSRYTMSAPKFAPDDLVTFTNHHGKADAGRVRHVRTWYDREHVSRHTYQIQVRNNRRCVWIGEPDVKGANPA